jgi:hypothetical protein
VAGAGGCAGPRALPAVRRADVDDARQRRAAVSRPVERRPACAVPGGRFGSFPAPGPAHRVSRDRTDGAEIFLREVQAVWTDLPPLADAKVEDGERRLGLPTDADDLSELAGDGHRAELAAALVRVSLNPDLMDDVHPHLSDVRPRPGKE